MYFHYLFIICISLYKCFIYLFSYLFIYLFALTLTNDPLMNKSNEKLIVYLIKVISDWTKINEYKVLFMMNYLHFCPFNV